MKKRSEEIMYGNRRKRKVGCYSIMEGSHGGDSCLFAFPPNFECVM